MILENNQADYLKQWMVLKLKPICDADHEVLSEYIMALLRHDQPENELMASCSKQLEDFLQQDTELFVTHLFDHLRAYGAFDGSYQPPKIDLTTSNTLRKRSLIVDEPYLLPPSSLLNSLENSLPQSSAVIPQYTPTQSHPSFLHFPDPQPNPPNSSPSQFSNSSMQPYPQASNPLRSSKRPRKSGICRDYHYRGYCARGGNCQFSHDEKDPNSSSSSSFTTNPYPKILTGETELATAPSTGSCLPLAFTPLLNQQIPGLGGPLPVLCDRPVSTFSSTPSNPVADRLNTHNSRHTDRPSRPEGPSPTNKKSNTTLVIENIPQSSLSDRAVRDYFSHFGPLSSVSVDVYNAQAIVTFNSSEDAKQAYSSPEPVFNNRFVKIHFKRMGMPLPRRYQGSPRTGGNQFEPLTHNESTEHLNSNNGYHPIRSYETSTAPVSAPSVIYPISSSPSSLPSDVNELSQRQEELRKKIEAQKKLLEQLSKKKAQQNQTGKPNNQDATEITTNAPPKPNSELSNSQSSSIGQSKGNRNIAESKELESIGDSKQPSPEPYSHLLSTEQTTSTVVAADSNSFNQMSPTYVSRGGRNLPILPRNSRTSWVANASNNTPAKSFKLDNRSCTLAIRGIPSLDSRDMVKSYLEQFGPIVSVLPLDEDESLPDLRLQFATRAAAEKALASGMEIPEVGKLTVNWISTGTSPTTTTVTSLSSHLTHPSFIPGLKTGHNHHYNPGSFSLINHSNLNQHHYSLIGSMKIENHHKLSNSPKIQIDSVNPTNGITSSHSHNTHVVDVDLNDDFCVDDEIDGCWKR